MALILRFFSKIDAFNVFVRTSWSFEAILLKKKNPNDAKKKNWKKFLLKSSFFDDFDNFLANFFWICCFSLSFFFG